MSDKITLLIIVLMLIIVFIFGGVFGYNIRRNYVDLKLKQNGYKIYENETVVHGVTSNWWEIVRIRKE